MKKSFAALLCLTLCLLFVGVTAAEQAGEYAVGSTVTFGHYEQDNHSDNGKEAIEWVVLETDGQSALLISAYCLDSRAYHTQFVRMTWAECALRTWLNDTFFSEAFSTDEQARIQPVTRENPDNTRYQTKGGEGTVDRVFLLNHIEIYEYFPDQAGRRALPTEYAKANGAYVDKSGYAWWWLSSPGVRPIDACGVRADGRVSAYGSRDVDRPSGSIRPVIRVELGE